MRAIDEERDPGQGYREGEQERGRRDQKVFTHGDSRIKRRCGGTRWMVGWRHH